jgi:hypothetical protein
MQAYVAVGGRLAEANCAHVWQRMNQLEEELSTVVYVRSCVLCGRLEAMAGHKNPANRDGWEVIEG